MNSTIIEVKDVSLDFPLRAHGLEQLTQLFRKKKSFKALKNISIDIKKGEVFGIIGKNGSGKSTLLRVITGILPTDAGQVLCGGEQTLLSGLGTGFSSLQTGRENAIIFGITLGHNVKKIEEKMDYIIQFSELGDFIDQPLRTYSAGMKARLGLAVASAIEPDILLIDEVLGVGDPRFREKSTNRILELVQDAGTVVIVSHSFGLMKSICTRIAHIHNGEIVFVGDPELAIKSYYDLED